MYVHPDDFFDARDARLARHLSEAEYQRYLNSYGQGLDFIFQPMKSLFKRIFCSLK